MIISNNNVKKRLNWKMNNKIVRINKIYPVF